MMYKVRYDLVAIPAPEYLARNKRESRNIYSLAYRQIRTTQRLQVGFFKKNPIERSAAAAAAADDDDDDVSQ